jgi:hypothetical protein
MIDPATGWFEIVEATNKSATSIQDLLGLRLSSQHRAAIPRELDQVVDGLP